MTLHVIFVLDEKKSPKNKLFSIFGAELSDVQSTRLILLHLQVFLFFTSC